MELWERRVTVRTNGIVGRLKIVGKRRNCGREVGLEWNCGREDGLGEKEELWENRGFM